WGSGPVAGSDVQLEPGVKLVAEPPGGVTESEGKGGVEPCACAATWTWVMATSPPPGRNGNWSCERSRVSVGLAPAAGFMNWNHAVARSAATLMSHLPAGGL